jgi:hypothetical protein
MGWASGGEIFDVVAHELIASGAPGHDGLHQNYKGVDFS